MSLLRGDGSARPRAADHNGAALEAARRRKEATYPELARGTDGRARLVVLAADVVHRDGPILARIGKGSGKGCPHDPPGQGQGCEVVVGVQRGEGFLRVTPGAPTSPSHRERALDTRSGEGGQVLR